MVIREKDIKWDFRNILIHFLQNQKFIYNPKGIYIHNALVDTATMKRYKKHYSKTITEIKEYLALRSSSYNNNNNVYM